MRFQACSRRGGNARRVAIRRVSTSSRIAKRVAQPGGPLAALDDLVARATEQLGELDHRRAQLSGRHAEQGPGACRRQVQLESVLAAVVADHRGSGVQAPDQRREVGGGLARVGHVRHPRRSAQAEHHGQLTGRQAPVLARLHALVPVADQPLDKRCQLPRRSGQAAVQHCLRLHRASIGV